MTVCRLEAEFCLIFVKARDLPGVSTAVDLLDAALCLIFVKDATAERRIGERLAARGALEQAKALARDGSAPTKIQHSSRWHTAGS